MTSGTTRDHAVIIHGYGATPADHWFGWLAARLEADGISTTIPALPNSTDPDARAWETEVVRALGRLDERTIVVAHSLGCLAVLRGLRSLPQPWRVGQLVLVSGFVDPLPALPELDAFIGDGDGDNLSGVSQQVDRITVIRSDDDPLVPPALTDRLATLLGVSAQVVPGAGHFLAADGITSLPQAYAAIRLKNRHEEGAGA